MVHGALESETGRMACLKVFDGAAGAEPARLAEFERQVSLAAGVSHPNVAEVFGSFRVGGQLVMVREYFEEGGLDARLGGRPMAADAAIRMGLDVTLGLQAASMKGLVHRDLRPGNIQFDAHGRAKIVDFGMACLWEGMPRQQGTIWGSPGHLPPERLDGQPEDFRADIYSLGVLMWEALAGCPLIATSDASVSALKGLKAKAGLTKGLASHVGEGLAAVIARCLRCRPGERFANHFELMEALEKARQQAPAVTGTMWSPRTLGADARGQGKWLVAGALATCLLAGATFWLLPKIADRTQELEGAATAALAASATAPPSDASPEIVATPAPTPAAEPKAAPDGLNLRATGSGDFRGRGMTPKKTPSDGGPAITGFVLVNAETDEDIGPLSDNGTIHTGSIGTRALNIRAEGDPPHDFGSVAFELRGATSRATKENEFAWTLFGDDDGNYRPGSFNTGAHVLTATPYPQNGTKGTPGTPMTVRFTVTD